MIHGSPYSNFPNARCISLFTIRMIRRDLKIHIVKFLLTYLLTFIPIPTALDCILFTAPVSMSGFVSSNDRTTHIILEKAVKGTDV